MQKKNRLFDKKKFSEKLNLIKEDSFKVVLFLIILIGVLIRFPLLDSYPMDRDELARVVPEFALKSFVPPGFLALFKFSAPLFDYSDLGYRFPAFIFGVAGIAVTYYLGRKFFGKIEGFLSAIIYTGLLTTIGYSVQTKEYTALIFFSGLSNLLAYKIIFEKKDKKNSYFLYLIITLFAILFSSYFYILVIGYQFTIISIFKIIANLVKIKRKILSISRSKKDLLLSISLAAVIIFLSFMTFKVINNYFGIYLVRPKIPAIVNYFQEIAYFVTQDVKYARFLNLFFFFGIATFIFSPRYRKGYLYILMFGIMDVFLVSSMRFLHLAYPFGYPRYHAFLLPLYIIATTSSAVGAAFLLGVITDLIKSKIIFIKELRLIFDKRLIIFGFLSLFIFFNLKYSVPMIRWFYTVPTSILLTNYKDAGEYLNLHMEGGDTLVRVKTPGMAHKFNHVNKYVNRALFSGINYAIFPERTSKTNWYVPIGTGEEDLKAFPDFLKIERIRPTFRFDAPYIYKLDYYGPLVATRQVFKDSGWKVFSNVNNDASDLTIDGDLTTGWTNQVETGDFFILDLGGDHYLNSVNYNFASRSYPQNFTLWTSQDGNNWQPVFTTVNPGPHPHDFSRSFFKPTRARFLKIDFIVDPLVVLKTVDIREIEVFEAYQKEIGINKEDIFNAEPVKHFNFSNDFEGWSAVGSAGNLRIENGGLRGQIGDNATTSGLKASVGGDSNQVNFINFALQADKGRYASLILKIAGQIFNIDKIPINSGGILKYYSLSLDAYKIPAEARTQIGEIILIPSDVSGAEFRLEFFSLDKNNLPGIEVADKESPNGFSQLIHYDPEDEYYLFQIGNKLQLPKGKYIAHFKIKTDLVDPLWRGKLKPPPAYRLYEYVEPKDVSPNDILYISMETTRGTFFELPGYLIVRGEKFTEANKYYDFSINFEANGKEALFLQGFFPQDRRYPANLYITYPEIERVK